MTQRQNLSIYQGQDFSFVHVHGGSSPIDISGYSARMSIRRGYGANLDGFLSSGSDAIDGTLTLGGAAGTITITMTADQTDDMLASDDLDTILRRTKVDPIEKFIYDLEIVSGAGVVTRVIEGEVFLHRNVTR